MAQLMMQNQKKYVPSITCQNEREVHVETIFFDGDALTEERARNVQWTFKDGDNKLDRLEGLDPLHTDWHTKLKLYEVSGLKKMS